MGVQLVGIGAFGAKMAARDGRSRIALDGDELSMLVIDHLPAAHAAVRTHGSREFRVLVLGKELPGAFAHRLNACAIGAGPELAHERPAFE
jgi:hypothetical protein